jgi:hypothetical protein
MANRQKANSKMEVTITGRKLTFSNDTRRRNPDLFVGDVLTQKPEPKTRRTLDRSQERPGPGAARLGARDPVLRVTLIRFCHRPYDSDNLAGGFKPLRDAIAAWLGLDDSDRIIAWEYGQHQTAGREGTAVRIEKL